MSEQTSTVIKNHWKSDLLAGFSVALVAMPLALGVSIASDVPPLAGVMTSVIAGFLTTFYRGTSIGINGTSNGMIVITAGAMVSLADVGGPAFNAFPHVLGAFLVSGILMTLIGVLKLGRIGDMLPSSVIYGMLAAIGILIITSQVDDALGTVAAGKSFFKVFLALPQSLSNMNIIIFTIALCSFLFSMFYHKLPQRFFGVVPAPVWVLIGSIAVVIAVGFTSKDSVSLLGMNIEIGKKFLISLPGSIKESIVFCSFAKIHTLNFWMVVLSSTLILTIESLLSAKSVEKLDPYKRKTNLNKDMVGMGLSTVAASLIGALPVVTVILRSTVAINQGGRTKWVNFFHGLFILIFVLALSGLIQLVPLATLAGILIYTGYKLAAPKVFIEAYQKGWEQLLYLVATLFVTLYSSNLMIGLAFGICICFIIQLIKTEIHPKSFFQSIRTPQIDIAHRADNFHMIKVNGVLNFANSRRFFTELDNIKSTDRIGIDFAHARLIDSTVLENLYDFEYKYIRQGGKLEMIGMDNHRTSSSHPLAMHFLPPKKEVVLSRRQRELKELADSNGWEFKPEVNWFASNLQKFDFFNSRPIEYKNNFICGEYNKFDIKWEIADITFDEGAGLATEVFHTTTLLVYIPNPIPNFTLEREGFFNRFRELANHQDVNFGSHSSFSKKYLLHGPKVEPIKNFFNPRLLRFLEGQDIYHIESNGEALLIFKFGREAHTNQVQKMLTFTEQILENIDNKYLQTKEK